MPLPRRDRPSLADQPALPLDLGAAVPAPPRARLSRSRLHGEGPVQFSLEIAAEPANGAEEEIARPLHAEPPPPASPPSCAPVVEHPEESLESDAEPPAFDPDPFAEIPGMASSAAATREYVLLPGSLRGRLDLRELTRFLATLRCVVRDWEGTPEVDDGGIRLRGPEGGAWIYPEPNRVRLSTDGELTGPAGEDLVALCRWVEGRAGMRLYPAGESTGAGVDRSLDPWGTFLGR